MGQIFGQLPDILKYGFPGLSAIVLVLTFFLLSKQNTREEPNKSMLQAIYIFMGLSLILSIIYFIDARLSSNKRPPVEQKVSITGTIKNDKTGLPMENAEIYLMPATGNDLVTTTDDQGNFVFKSVPEKLWWMFVVRDINSETKSSGRGMINPAKIKDTILVYGAKIDYQMQPIK